MLLQRINSNINNDKHYIKVYLYEDIYNSIK